MPETVHRRKQPTEKMVSFAQKIAERKQLTLPPLAVEDYEICRTFLDQHGAILPPTEKALNWALDIAKKKNLKLSAETCGDARLLSAWIEEHR